MQTDRTGGWADKKAAAGLSRVPSARYPGLVGCGPRRFSTAGFLTKWDPPLTSHTKWVSPRDSADKPYILDGLEVGVFEEADQVAL